MNNKNKCDIIKDLIPGYIENLLSDTSKKFIEEHIKECEECRNLIETMKNNNIEKNKKIEEEENQEYNHLKKYKKNLNKRNTIIKIIVAIIIIIVIINIVIFAKYYVSLGKMQIFLKNSVTQEQIENIKSIIKSKDANAEITYSSKEEVLENLKEGFKENRKLLENYNETNSPLVAVLYVDTQTKYAESILQELEKTENSQGIKRIVSRIRTVTINN